MTLPPQPRIAREILIAPPRSAERSCPQCNAPLTSHGAPPLRTAGVGPTPDGVLQLEMFWCPNCGKVEFYSSR